jgi:hypothetical protein
LAEKGLLHPDLSLWMGNLSCLAAGTLLIRKMLRQ